jgi:hypothetical protein
MIIAITLSLLLLAKWIIRRTLIYKRYMERGNRVEKAIGSAVPVILSCMIVITLVSTIINLF